MPLWLPPTSDERLVAFQNGEFELDTDSDQAQGIRAMWPLGVDGGNTDDWDYSGFNSHGSRVNGPTQSVSQQPGGRATSLLFDAVDQYVDIGVRPQLTSGRAFALCWWERITANTGAYPRRFIFSINGTSDHFFVMRVKVDNLYGYLSWGRSPNTTAISIKSQTVSAPSAKVGVWTHFCITGEDPRSGTASDYQVYEDGVSFSVANGEDFGAITGNRIGYTGTGTGADADFFDVRIYDKKLNPQEVVDIHNSPEAIIRPIARKFSYASAVAAGALTGTVTSSITKSDVVTGGKTVILTLTGDTWVA